MANNPEESLQCVSGIWTSITWVDGLILVMKIMFDTVQLPQKVTHFKSGPKWLLASFSKFKSKSPYKLEPIFATAPAILLTSKVVQSDAKRIISLYFFKVV